MYQAAAYPLPMFPRQSAIHIFGDAHMTVHTPHCLTWRVETMVELVALFGTMLNEASKYVANLTRAITTKSEPTARVLAMLIPPFEVSSFTTPSGSDRLHINLMYTLWDQGGGMHPPKDELWWELLYTPAEEATFRTQILRDARQLAMQGAPLSSAWYGLIGLQEHASAVAVAEASGAALPLRQPRVKKKKGQGEVDCKLEERKTAGRAGSWVLVRWAGYHPSWEEYRIHDHVGTPLETWEPLKNVRHCTELAKFRASHAV